MNIRSSFNSWALVCLIAVVIGCQRDPRETVSTKRNTALVMPPSPLASSTGVGMQGATTAADDSLAVGTDELIQMMCRAMID
jgi:hypothetical protein